MLGIRDFSIKNKLMLMQMITSIMVLGLCFVAFVITDIRDYKEREVRSTISIAQVIGNNSVSAIQFLDNEAARKLLADLFAVETNIVNASILDSENRIFAALTRGGHQPYLFPPPFEDRYIIDNNYLYIWQKISNESNGVIGTVCLQVELVQLEEIKQEKFEIAILLLLIGIALAFLIAYINQRYISNPLMNLVNVMRQIRQSGEYSRHVDESGKDEISMLSAEFNSLMDEVVKSHQKKDEFIGIASHELKTPLTSVKLYLEALSKMKHEGLVQSFVGKARDGVDKLHSLILDLLDVSKIESGQLQLNQKQVDIDALVDECVEDAMLSTPGHRILRQGFALNSQVTGDRDRLEQVIINLISNAAKYSAAGSDIIVSTEKKDGRVIVSVQDFGIGIAEPEQKKIFGRFYRAPDSNAVISGFGLGLYICSQIIKRHGGRIGLESEEGVGSRFYFSLPVSNTPKPEA